MNEEKSFPKTTINWVSRIYGKPPTNAYKIRKTPKKVFTYF